MFEIQKVRGINTDKLVEGNDYDYVTRTSYNQGVLQTTGKVKGQAINEVGTWSLGLLQMDFFYRKKEWYAGQFVRKIVPKIQLNEEIILFFTTIFNSLKKVLLSVLVRDVDNKFLNMKIELPVKNGNVDYNFMIELISELEEERISELKNYLKVTGLDNYALNPEEEKALEIFDNVKWKEFRLEELFDITGTKSLDSNAVIFVNEGINFVGRTFEDNGVQGKLEKQDFEPNEPYTITATVIGNYKYVKYQTEPYYCSQNINKLKPKDIIEKWNKKIAYFFVANIQKFVSQYNYQQGGYKLPDIKNHIIKVPIDSNGKIDYDYIYNLIFALEKEVIKGVVDYADENIEATKKVVRKKD